MMRRFEKVARSVRKAILDLFSPKVSVLPLQLIRVTEKFDIVARPPFRDGFTVRS
jgi:hypothetical protein